MTARAETFPVCFLDTGSRFLNANDKEIIKIGLYSRIISRYIEIILYPKTLLSIQGSCQHTNT